jgi:hypothetical protein
VGGRRCAEEGTYCMMMLMKTRFDHQELLKDDEKEEGEDDSTDSEDDSEANSGV